MRITDSFKFIGITNVPKLHYEFSIGNPNIPLNALIIFHLIHFKAEIIISISSILRVARLFHKLGLLMANSLVGCSG